MSLDRTPFDATNLGFPPGRVAALSGFRMNDFPFAVEDTPAVFRINPPRRPYVGVTVTTLIIAAGFVGFWVLFDRVVRPEDQRFAKLAIYLIGGMTLSLYVVLSIARQQHFERRGPLIDYDKAAGTLRLPGGRTFKRDDVIGLVCLSVGGGRNGMYAEMNLIAREDGTPKRFFLMTKMDPRRRALDRYALPFVTATGLPAYRIWPENGGALAQRIVP